MGKNSLEELFCGNVGRHLINLGFI